MQKKKIIIAGVVAVLLVIAWGIKQYIDIKKPQELINDQKEIEELEKKSAKDGVMLEFQQDTVNILFLGFDKNEGRESKYRLFRPDGIILMSINFETDKINLISFPRDSRVWIAHRPGKDKINASFYYGHDEGGGNTDEENEQMGYQYCVDTVSEFLGNIYINNYVAIDMDGFREIIDQIGGITLTVQEDMYDDTKNGELIAKAGTQTLNGKQFLAYVRDRDKTNEKDKERTQRTQEAFVTVMNQLKSQNMLKLLPDLFDTYQRNIRTDLTVKEMTSLALYGQKIAFDSISLHVVEGQYDYINDIIYYIPDEEERINLVKEAFGIEFEPTR
ncbi:MAG: LCP family protein [Eubacteriales bacterium]